MASKKHSSSRKSSRRTSKKRLNPALSKMSKIVKKLSKETNLSGPKLMVEAGKIYRKQKGSVKHSRKHSRKGSRKHSSKHSRKGSR